MFEREKSVAYAYKWAFSFNPAYYNFSELGGDCTNFVSQCVHAGNISMNYLPDGWYYVNLNRRAPAWTGVNEFWNFAVTNKSVGLKIRPCDINDIEIADVVQLGNGVKFYHTVLVTYVERGAGLSGIKVAAHDNAAFNKPLIEYGAAQLRFGKVFE